MQNSISEKNQKKQATPQENSIAWLCQDCIRSCKQLNADIISCPKYSRQLTFSFDRNPRKKEGPDKK